MKRWLAQLTLGGVALGLVACAAPGGQGRISGGSSDNLSPQERRLQEVENRLVTVVRRLDALDAATGAGRSPASRDELRQLNGEVEQLRNELRQMDQRGRQQYLDLDQRLRALEGGGAGQFGFGAVPGAPAAVTPAPGRGAMVPVAPADPEEEASYLAAFELLKNTRYDEAIAAFRRHLERFPNGRNADNAAYWMAEASFVKRDYRTAAAAFQRVVDEFPLSVRAPDALFKLGQTQLELGRRNEARATFQQVIDRYPNSNAARLAQQRLSAN